MTVVRSAKVQNLLFYISIFRIDSPGLVEPVQGSCGLMSWHAEVVHYTLNGQSVTYLVIYQSSRGIGKTSYELPKMLSKALDIANSLLLPIAFRAQEYVGISLMGISILDDAGNEQGGCFPLKYAGRIGPSIYIASHDYPLLNESPKLKRALQYFNVGLYSARVELYADACMNYVRAVEALMGMYEKSVKKEYAQECARVGIDFDDVTQLMAKLRNQWAIAHVSGTPAKNRKLKDMPDAKTEQKCQDICRTVIIYYWEQGRQNGQDKKVTYSALYYGFGFAEQIQPVPTLWADHNLGFGSSNLPRPNEVIQKYLQRGGSPGATKL